MGLPDDPRQRLQQLLGSNVLATLRQRLRRAYAEAAPGVEPATLRLAGLAPHEAELLQSLSGRPPRAARSMQLDLQAIDQRLRTAGLANGLRAALEALDGPIVLRHELQTQVARWQALAAVAAHPTLATWLSQPQALGLLKRLAVGDLTTAQALCDAAAAVLQALPAAGLPRAQLAARWLGDAHALDDGQPVATLVLAALRHAADPQDAESRRSLWARQGVAVNELARPALALNLPGPGGALRPGEPQYWSLRQLLRQPPAWQVQARDVFVCENPNLLALAADALGARCAPLVCSEGMPAAAQQALLHQLRQGGAHLHYHGDFDWPGLVIGNQLMGPLGARPWRFATRDYHAALASVQPLAAPLRGDAVVAAWDAGLAPAMQHAGRAMPEEALFDALRPDLDAA